MATTDPLSKTSSTHHRARASSAMTRGKVRQPFFRATATRFDLPEHRVAIDEIANWVHANLSNDLDARPSRHLYISTLPEEVTSKIDVLRLSTLVMDTIRNQYPADVEITPMQTTDELYISHYNKDLGGDHGLFAKHYDGNLRFVPFAAVVRALIYVRSTGNYTVVFADSGLSKGFQTYDLGLLDFHRELHWVDGAYEEHGPDRIVLKCNYLVVPKGHETLRRSVLNLNLFQFYVVKAAMESSKSPTTVWQRALGLVCNVVRVLNNVHPILPHVLFVSAPVLLIAVVWWSIATLLA